MRFATGPFTRFQRSYSELMDYYGDFWRLRLSSDVSPSQKKLRVQQKSPPSGLIDDDTKRYLLAPFKKINSIIGRVTTGIARLAQRRSWPTDTGPRQRPRRRHRHGKSQSDHDHEELRSFESNNKVEETHGPPLSVSSEHPGQLTAPSAR